MTHDYPILEYDATRDSVIEPTEVITHVERMPQHVVFCFFREVIQAVCAEGGAEVVDALRGHMHPNPIYALEHDGQRVAVMHPGVGAPLAAGRLEAVIARGGRKFVACGGSGVLDSGIVAGAVVVPDVAVRDEGTSYHYLPPSREVRASARAVEAIAHTLEAHGLPYLVGKTWTTDAVYRETRPKIARRREEGCLTVEMEAAAFFAVAQFRGVPFGHILYGGDDVSGESYDLRDWIHGQASTREQLFWLAIESVLRL
jgi:uridine phosphorylase